MRLQRLTAMEKDKLEADLVELSREITEYIDILSFLGKIIINIKNPSF